MNFSRNEFFYVSNLLSFARVVVIIPVAYLIIVNTPAGNRWLLLLVILGVLTDFLDGHLSRRLNQVTDLGKILDPLADKTAMAVVLAVLIFYRGFPLSLVILLLYRDVLIVLLGYLAFRKTKHPAMANFWGKLNTVVVSAACILFMFNFTNGVFVFVLAVSYLTVLISGISYLRVGEQLLFSEKRHRWWFRAGIALLTLLMVYLSIRLSGEGDWLLHWLRQNSSIFPGGR